MWSPDTVRGYATGSYVDAANGRNVSATVSPDPFLVGEPPLLHMNL